MIAAPSRDPLILLVGPPGSGKTQRLRQLAAKLNRESINVALELARLLAATPKLHFKQN